MKPPYEVWLHEIYKLLDDPGAIKLVTAPNVLETWYKFGAHPKRVSNVLNERWQVKVKPMAHKAKVI